MASKRPGSNIRDIITEIARKGGWSPDFNKGYKSGMKKQGGKSKAALVELLTIKGGSETKIADFIRQLERKPVESMPFNTWLVQGKVR